MNATVNVIASELPKMTAEELMKIRQMTDMLIGNKEQTEPEDKNEQILLNAVRLELSVAGFKSSISFKALQDSSYFRSWRKGLGVVNNFTSREFDEYIQSESHRLGLYRVFIRSLIADMGRMGISISLGSISRNLQRVPQAVDRSFPNYLKYGLGYLIAQSMLRAKGI